MNALFYVLLAAYLVGAMTSEYLHWYRWYPMRPLDQRICLTIIGGVLWPLVLLGWAYRQIPGERR